MLKIGITYREIDYLIYTHFHVDHIGELPSIIFASKYPSLPREKDLTIIGPPGIVSFYTKLKSLYFGQLEDLPYGLQIVEIGDHFSGERWDLFSFKVRHKEESVAYKLVEKKGKTLVYTGDTEYFPSLLSFLSSVDLLILECAVPISKEGHLSPSEIIEIIEKTSPKEVVITHLYPETDREEVLSPLLLKFKEKVRIASDFMRIEL
jgi:ribonuclease BN (tRNA processing enzyme)